MAVAAVLANLVGAQFVKQSDPYFIIFCMYILQNSSIYGYINNRDIN